MSFLKRFTDIKKGGIVFIGNTLGLSKLENLTASGTLGSIGAFTSLNTSLQVPTFPQGTTLNYLENGSSATLNILSDSKILYAELIWGGLYRSSNNNISNLLDNSIRFSTPTQSTLISPDTLTKREFTFTQNNTTIGFYARSANVTSLLQNNFNGTYSVQAVPALIEALETRTFSTNHAGWTLAIVYENSSLPLRNLNLWAGGVIVSPLTLDTDISISGFLTPDVAPISGKLFVSSAEGDAVISGDQMLFGSDTSTLTNLSGPNNPVNNFFASQINDSNGLLDTTGTFGTRNANAFTGTNTSGCRQGWDITAIDLTNKLQTSQKTASIRFTSDGDLYLANGLGLQIDSKGANIVAEKSVDKSFAEIGESIQYQIQLTNTGDITADNVIVSDNLFNYLELVPNSILIDGVPYIGTFPLNIGSINVNQTRTISFEVIANSVPAINPVINIAKVDYQFAPFDGLIISSSTNTSIASVYITDKNMSITKEVDKNYAIQAETLTYTTTIINNGNLTMFNILFRDNIPVGTKFILGSVYINDINQSTYDPNIGFNIGNLVPGDSIIVKFNVIVE